MVTLLPRGLPAALCLTALEALAQPTTPAIRPDPLDAKASVPPLLYRSSLLPVRTPEADKAITWREANDNVGRIGGWRTYLREAHGAEPGHSGHKAP